MNRRSNANHHIVAFDFSRNPFNGDARQAHQFIPFVTGKLAAAQLSYILNTTDHPDPVIPEALVILEQDHAARMTRATVAYKARKQVYERSLEIYEATVRRLSSQQDQGLITLAEFDKQILELPIPNTPDLLLPTSDFTSHQEKTLSTARSETRKFEIASDAAMEVIKLYMTPRLITQCSAIFVDTTVSARKKLLTIWEWLKAKRVHDTLVATDIKKDIQLLPSADTFEQAEHLLESVNVLQAELTTLRQGLSDLELIITHTGKLSADPCFIALKMQYLQNNPFRNADLPPSFTTTPSHLPVITWTWAAYSADVHHYARAHGASRTQSVLAAHVDTATSPDVDPTIYWSSNSSTNKRFITGPSQDHPRSGLSRPFNTRDHNSYPTKSRPLHSGTTPKPSHTNPSPGRGRPPPSPPKQMSDTEFERYKVARNKMLQQFKTEYIQNLKKTKPTGGLTQSNTSPNKRTYATMADQDEDVEPDFDELNAQDMQIMQASAAHPSEDEDHEDHDDIIDSTDYDAVIHGVSR